MQQDFMQLAQAIEHDVISWRRKIHENPELSFQEYATADLIECTLREFGYQPKRIGETGVLAILEGAKGPGKTVALRADMDALPGEELSGLPFASKNTGVVHSCGHDVHTAILLGAARVLSGCTENFSGRIKFFFQPAEEKLGGAKTFVEAGELDDVDGVAALHVMTDIETGCIATKKGACMAATDTWTITVTGKAAHGAQPHRGLDAIVAAAQIVTALQTVVSRSVSPLDSAVVTIGTINGGTAANIIPGKVILEGTLRTLRSKTRDIIIAKMRQIAERTASAFEAEGHLAIQEGTPPLVCDEGWVDRLERVAKEFIPAENFRLLPEPSMGGEDFAFMLQKAPGVFWRLGARAKGAEVTHTHSATFTVDEACLVYGVAISAALAIDALSD